MSFEKEFSELKIRCRHHIRSGQTDAYSACLKEIAGLFEREGRFADEFKFLIPAFYIDLSGIGRAPYIDKAVLTLIDKAISGSGFDLDKLSQLYSEIICPDMIPEHKMSIDESFYLFRLCVEQKVAQAEYILEKL